MGENFNDNLKEARLKRNLSQKEVADQIGVAKSTYSLYESGNREPSVQTIKKISDVLNVSADELLGLTEQPPTIAAHFDGDEYTEEELDKIKEFAAFVKSTRKNEDKRATQKAAAPAPADDAPLVFPDHLTVNAAHARNDVEATDEMQQHDEDIMDDENF